MSATTPSYALPYLELEDPPDIAGGLQGLAEAVEGQLARVDAAAAGGDWHTLSLAAGVEVQAGLTPGYRAVGPVVYLRGLIKPSTSWAAGTVYTVTESVISAGFRPPQAVYTQVAAHTADAAARLIVLSTGVVQLTTGAAPPSWVDLSAVYWLTD